MLEHQRPAAFVQVWAATTTPGMCTDRLLDLYEQALSALWERSRPPLGQVTLEAIADRALYNVTEKYPILHPVGVVTTGFDLAGLRARALPEIAVCEAFNALLVEFLTVIGNLTAGVLTPVLHAELTRTQPTPQPDQTTMPDGQPTGLTTDGEEARP